MTSHPERRPVRALRLHPIATQLLDSADLARLFPNRTEAESIEVLPDGTVLTGNRTVLRAKRSEQKDVDVWDDLADEDPAFVAGAVVKDVLAGTTDPIAVGTASAAFRRCCAAAKRPRKGYPRTEYERRFGMGPAERLEQITRDTFGLSDDQLRRMEAVLLLPSELHEALRAEAVPLKSLVALAALPPTEVTAVVTEIRSGTPAAAAVAGRLSRYESRPAARTALRRLLQANDQAVADLGDRVSEVGYLTDVDRSRIESGRDLHNALLRLPTEGEVRGHIARVMGRASGGEEAA